MMIWKARLAANGKPPIPQIAEERVRIAETAKCKKRTRADFVGRERSALAAETAEPKQSSRGSENRILIELPDRLERSRGRFGTSKNNQICAAHGRNGFPKAASWQQRLPRERSRRIHQKNIQVAGELQMLKPVIQKKNVNKLLRFDPVAFGEAVFAHPKRDAAPQTKFHQLDLVACAIRASVTAAQNRNTLSISEKFLGEPNHHGRFASTANL